MNLKDRYKSLPISTRRMMNLGAILALVVALPLFVWSIVNLNFNQNKKAATGEPPVNHPAYWNTENVIISADDFYVIIAGEYYFADNSSVAANTVAIDANTLQTNIATQEHNRDFSLRIIFKKGNGLWWAESIEGRIDGNQFVTYNGPFINYTVGYPYSLDGEHYFEFTDPYDSSQKGILYATNLFVHAFTSATPPPTVTSSPTASPTATASPTVTASPTATATATSAPIAGDVNSDGIINIVDLGIIVDHYGENSVNFPSADLNGDGRINVVDIQIVIDNY